MMPTRRAALAATLAAMPLAVHAQWSPDRPVRWLVGYPAGGGTDVLARLLANGMAQRLGQPVVVENRPGAATNIAAEAAARAEPDGHTVFTAGNETLVFNPALYRNLSFDLDRDLRPLGLMARFHLVVAVRNASPATTLRALLDRAKAEPGRVDYGSPGIGSPHHLAMERLARDSGVRFNHVPYRGMAPVLNDLMAGTVEAAVVDVAAGGEALRSGRIRPLAVCSPARHPTLPEVPTVAEAAGLGGFEAYAWQGLTAPARTPEAAAARLAQALSETLAEAPVQARMREIGLEPLTGGAAEYRALIEADRAIYWPLIRELGLRLD
ncbi:Bug family tripartite tricarboxylate transporter substrate binding protein [Roseicella aerolata]|uniref:Tripartite tricarboxylate transporter substrate binding protein n=1 Tax=Roseicella aerolata TaxID=2883479 RepID=A0A9X1ILQ4_9PROT|nr:tripartite tricarboxylate transporter substrate binding protein [Roseicella aerolata]MCB4825440.1 tripartite tricarboxylate transporter substrate binding protein [Roseicella aerolata]